MSDATNTPPKPEPSKFTYDTGKVPTGKMQFRTNGPAKVHVEKIGDVSRGEVVAVKSVNVANSLWVGGNFAHVPADTPLGVPAELRPVEKKADTGTGTPTKAPLAATAANPVNLTGEGSADAKK
jgi:hypothetical protein